MNIRDALNLAAVAKRAIEQWHPNFGMRTVFSLSTSYGKGKTINGATCDPNVRCMLNEIFSKNDTICNERKCSNKKMSLLSQVFRYKIARTTKNSRTFFCFIIIFIDNLTKLILHNTIY